MVKKNKPTGRDAGKRILIQYPPQFFFMVLKTKHTMKESKIYETVIPCLFVAALVLVIAVAMK